MSITLSYLIRPSGKIKNFNDALRFGKNFLNEIGELNKLENILNENNEHSLKEHVDYIDILFLLFYNLQLQKRNLFFRYLPLGDILFYEESIDEFLKKFKISRYVWLPSAVIDAPFESISDELKKRFKFFYIYTHPNHIIIPNKNALDFYFLYCEYIDNMISR